MRRDSPGEGWASRREDRVEEVCSASAVNELCQLVAESESHRLWDVCEVGWESSRDDRHAGFIAEAVHPDLQGAEIIGRSPLVVLIRKHLSEVDDSKSSRDAGARDGGEGAVSRILLDRSLSNPPGTRMDALRGFPTPTRAPDMGPGCYSPSAPWSGCLALDENPTEPGH